MSEFAVDGLQVAYHVRGRGPVCLAHPRGPGLHWPYLRMRELEEHLTMVYIEPIGTGDSDFLPDGDYTVDRHAQVVHRLINHLGQPKPFLLGHSYGGFVALQTALDYPNALRGLIVYDAMAYNGPERATQATHNIEALVGTVDPLGVQIVTTWRNITQGRARGTEALQRLLPAYFKDFRRADAGIAEWTRTAGLTVDPNRKESHWDIRERLRELAVPTLVRFQDAVLRFVAAHSLGHRPQAGRPPAAKRMRSVSKSTSAALRCARVALPANWC